ncbi:MAG: pantoate--beta-alanine ligase [Bacteroidaceae bacterium]|nr:pantoate--beta-alanine ligase [Bacteroidaceae bacterium]
MKVIRTISELKQELSACRNAGQSIGFVPTMGALHQGHASLVRRAVAENDIAVVSVFVNPTQFNDKNDLKNYPRDLQADCELLESIGTTYVFAPEVEEMYPEPDTRVFSFAPLDTVMEGGCRPGHFNGVAQIVSKLFYAVEADKAYFGEKDFQQLAIIREMVRTLQIPIEIIGCPIVRESDGLALSSRNMLLTAEERNRALTISRTLFASLEYAMSHTLAETKSFVEDVINTTEGLKLEYYQIVDGNTLQEIANWDDSDYVVGCIALFCGKIRLIDNIKYKEVK